MYNGVEWMNCNILYCGDTDLADDHGQGLLQSSVWAGWSATRLT